MSLTASKLALSWGSSRIFEESSVNIFTHHEAVLRGKYKGE